MNHLRWHKGSKPFDNKLVLEDEFGNELGILPVTKLVYEIDANDGNQFGTLRLEVPAHLFVTDIEIAAKAAEIQLTAPRQIDIDCWRVKKGLDQIS